jgi:TonB family protein
MFGLALSGTHVWAQDATGTLPPSPPTKVAKNPRPNRDPVKPTVKEPKRTRKPEPVTPVALATLTISANPPSAAISVNGNEIESRDANGALNLTGLKPGPYSLIISQQGYHEERRTISLAPGQVEAISIVLNLLPGKLNVSPSITGTQITVRKAGAGSDIGSYAERVSDLEVEPGVYQIIVSKNGYKPATREITVEPAKSAYLEPLLEAAPVEKPRIRSDGAMSMQTSNDGKYLTVILTGKSGDSAGPVGSLDVTLNMGDRMSNMKSVTGMLTGFPCQVDFVRIENIAEYSFIEPPGLGNQWGRVVVRIRPKDSKRTIHFAINWKALQSTPPESSNSTYSVPFEQAVIIRKVTPTYPAQARSARTAGLVMVSVDIDEQGSVISAKAVEGPMLLRQPAESAARQWKFQARGVMVNQSGLRNQFSLISNLES